MHFSSDSGRQLIVGVLHGGNASERQLECNPGTLANYAPVYEHLDWIRSMIGDERCITNSFQFEPEKVWPHLQTIALCILSISLIIALILILA